MLTTFVVNGVDGEIEMVTFESRGGSAGLPVKAISSANAD
jgi:hypothetical protein